jgi:hypothetical protein
MSPFYPTNPIIEPRTYGRKVPFWFFEDQLPPSPLGDDWGPPFPYPEDKPEPPPRPDSPSPPKKSRQDFAEAFAPQGARNMVPTCGIAPSIPFIAAAPSGALGGIPGLLMQAGAFDPSESDRPPAGGLLRLIQDYTRNDSEDDEAR